MSTFTAPSLRRAVRPRRWIIRIALATGSYRITVVADGTSSPSSPTEVQIRTLCVPFLNSPTSPAVASGPRGCIRTIGLAHEPRWSRTFDRGEHPFEDHDRPLNSNTSTLPSGSTASASLPACTPHQVSLSSSVAQGPTVLDRLESEEPLGSLPFLGGGPLKVRTGEVGFCVLSRWKRGWMRRSRSAAACHTPRS